MCIRDSAMISAARSGVDVRIVVPRIPDKQLIYLQTKANFRPLIEAGVRIYLYLSLIHISLP